MSGDPVSDINEAIARLRGWNTEFRDWWNPPVPEAFYGDLAAVLDAIEGGGWEAQRERVWDGRDGQWVEVGEPIAWRWVGGVEAGGPTMSAEPSLVEMWWTIATHPLTWAASLALALPWNIWAYKQKGAWPPWRARTAGRVDSQ